jgi:inositol phosphorylceramide mannosyltransferase catalytic subunit
MIPKIIHQIWIGDQSKRPTEMMQTWQDMNPDWEYMLWTDDNLPEISNRIQFDAMKELAGKADILRYELLKNYGGFFMDADSICTKTLDDFFVDNDSFCCWENEYIRTGLMCNGYLAACKDNELMGHIIGRISMIPPDVLHNAPPLTAWQITGPALLTDTVKKTEYNKLRIYPSHYFLPKHYSGMETHFKNESIYSEQYWGSTHTLEGKKGMTYGEG